MKAVLLFLLMAAAAVAQAQPPAAYAELDTAVLRIGEQTHLRLSVELDPTRTDAVVTWPTPTDTITARIEVLDIGPVDTLGNRPDMPPGGITLSRALRITSFDSGYWAIPPFLISVDGDTLATRPLLLAVNTVPVDTADAPREIKDIIELPFSLAYWLKQHKYWIAGGLGLALLAALLLIAWRRYHRRQPIAVEAPEPEVPLAERTLMALQHLEQKQLWQQGFHKQYHSELTDILRNYIEQRYEVHAMERTTDELMLTLKLSPIDQEALGMLHNMLLLADMVKFARVSPLPVENEGMMTNAIRFVERTTTSPFKSTVHAQ